MPYSKLEKYFLAAIVESSQDSIITINFDGVVTTWNKAAELLYGYSATEAIGNSLTALTLPEDFDMIFSNVDKIKNQKRVETFQTERVDKDKNRMILEVVMSPVKNDAGDVVGVSTIARDVTLRHTAARALQERQNLQKLIEAQEAERRRIARDLHDEIGQLLTVLKFLIEAEKARSKDQETRGRIEEMSSVLESIDKGVDFLAWELRPSALDDLGLLPAIENYVVQWSKHSGISAELHASNLNNIRLESSIETHLYRILQEALNNIHKHAEAKKVQVVLKKESDVIILIVEDDGKGFDCKNKKKLCEGMGLTGMKERAALIGGTVEIESAIGKGTVVFARIQESAIERKRLSTIMS